MIAKAKYRKYLQVAGITIQVESDLPITDETFASKFRLFERDEPGEDLVAIRHRFEAPDFDPLDTGKIIFENETWYLFQNHGHWIYLLKEPSNNGHRDLQVHAYSKDYSSGVIYHQGRHRERFLQGNNTELTLCPTDQVLLAYLLAERNGCLFHADSLSHGDKGLLFAGSSGSGKTTVAKMMNHRAEMISADRSVVRKWKSGFRLHGSWIHGTDPTVSANEASLHAVFFPEKAGENRLIPLKKRSNIVEKLLPCLLKPFETVDWWKKMFMLLEDISLKVPCYTLRFDRNGSIAKMIEAIVDES